MPFSSSSRDTSDIEQDPEDYGSDLELTSDDFSSLVVYSRDWTVETILSQIEKGNIDLEPKFQRRNAWDDKKRSRLVESLLLRVPVPEIVLAERRGDRSKYIVIDGKQRLLTIAGFFKKKFYTDIWTSKQTKLKNLLIRKDLEHKSMADIKERHEKDYNSLLNSDIRCTVLSGYEKEDVLYDIFYRLNTGSAPLSSQELRQALNGGPFADYLINITNKKIPLHNIMNIKGADKRLRDVEFILRYICFYLYGRNYKGNLDEFINDSMKNISDNWAQMENEIYSIVSKFHESSNLLLDIFPKKKAGRKYSEEKWESRFNRVLCEVEIYYFSLLNKEEALKKKEEFLKEFIQLSSNTLFSDAITSTTKTLEKSLRRYNLFGELMQRVYGIDANKNPFN